MKDVTIYTDGACSGNPGPGGWGSIVFYKETKKELSGYSEKTTNNIMELTAALEALELLKEKCNIKLYTDSQYVKNGITNWIFNWQKNGWKNSKKEPIKNSDIWKKLLTQSRFHKIEWIWVKGHSNNKYNEECDKLATNQIKINKN